MQKKNYEVDYELVQEHAKIGIRECSLDNFNQMRAETSVEKALFEPDASPFMAIDVKR
jgi:hypothetical protein